MPFQDSKIKLKTRMRTVSNGDLVHNKHTCVHNRHCDTYLNMDAGFCQLLKAHLMVNKSGIAARKKLHLTIYGLFEFCLIPNR